jgi:hypothetical protein
MKSALLTLFFTLLSLPFTTIQSRNSEPERAPSSTAASAIPVAEFAQKTIRELYQRFPSNTFSWEAFQHALTGFYNITSSRNIHKPHLLTLVDFSKPSTEKRLFVIDLQRGIILFSSLVAHGRNSGENMATQFSNNPESYQSSLGFYLTAETYIGKHGLSLRLDGLEPGINDKARERAIVVHGADYVSASFAAQQGRLGRSQGCPALPQELTAPIIETIRGGSVMFIFAPQQQYLSASHLLQPTDTDCLLDALAFRE